MAADGDMRDWRGNFVDRAIAYVAPTLGARRIAARLAIDTMSRGYDGAGYGRRLSNWHTTTADANAVAAGKLTTLINRCRDLGRNNPWSARAHSAISAHTVGHGINVEFRSADGKPIKELNDDFRLWAESTAVDVYGNFDFFGWQAVSMRSIAESGAVITRKVVDTQNATDLRSLKVCPLKLNLQECDYLDVQKLEQTRDGGRIVNGREFDAAGRPVAVWLYDHHPGDQLTPAAISRRVPASSVTYCYRVDRPGQLIGVPWGAPVIVAMRDLSDYVSAFLFRQKIMNCLTALVSPSPDVKMQTPPPLSTKLEPGAIEVLPPGSNVAFPTLPSPGDFGPFVREILYQVAAAYGISYQTLTGDLTRVNFTSGRMGRQDMEKNIDAWRWHMLVPLQIEPVCRWFLETWELWKGKRIEGGVLIQCDPPARELLDPSREVEPMIRAIRGGLTSLEAYQRSMGRRAFDVIEEIRRGNQYADTAGVKLDTDPRFTTANGGAVAPAANDDVIERDTETGEEL